MGSEIFCTLVRMGGWLGPDPVEHLPLHPGGGGAPALPLDLPPRRVRGHPQPLPRTLLHHHCRLPQARHPGHRQEAEVDIKWLLNIVKKYDRVQQETENPAVLLALLMCLQILFNCSSSISGQTHGYNHTTRRINFLETHERWIDGKRKHLYWDSKSSKKLSQIQ